MSLTSVSSRRVRSIARALPVRCPMGGPKSIVDHITVTDHHVAIEVRGGAAVNLLATNGSSSSSVTPKG